MPCTNLAIGSRFTYSTLCYNLLLKDTSNAPEDELTKPEEIAEAIAFHLSNAWQKIETIIEEFTISHDCQPTS